MINAIKNNLSFNSKQIKQTSDEQTNPTTSTANPNFKLHSQPASDSVSFGSSQNVFMLPQKAQLVAKALDDLATTAAGYVIKFLDSVSTEPRDVITTRAIKFKKEALKALSADFKKPGGVISIPIPYPSKRAKGFVRMSAIEFNAGNVYISCFDGTPTRQIYRLPNNLRAIYNTRIN